MTNSALPWDQIATPGSDFNVRLAAKDMTVPVYWGKDPRGQWLTIVELEGDHSQEFGRDPVIVHGVDVDLRAGDSPKTQKLILTLQDKANADLFLGLCQTLLSAMVPVTSSTVAMSVALAHIRRWKAFLSGRRTGILSPEEVRGLFAELQFLRRLYKEKLGHADAVTAWTGADRVQQDFIFQDTAVEVKALSGRERNSVRISSEDQLESLSSRLFLVVHRLADLPDSPEAISLNALVELIEAELTSGAAIDTFLSKLSAAGYAPLQDYQTPTFVVGDVMAYSVTDGFPRLVRSEIPVGIARLSYELELESLEPFKCTTETVLGGTDGPDA